jgi:hypothetical protein
MFLPIGCFLVGALVMGRTKPQTQVRKLTALGPRSGIVYTVEDLPEVGSIIVRAPGKAAIGQFLRRSVKDPRAIGFTFQTGQGDPRLIEAMRRDFEPPELERPAAAEPEPKAPSKSATNGARSSSPS